MNTLYLHIGLKKTGTSALQVLFAQNRDTIRNYGIHYPAWSIEEAQAGRINSGNGLKMAQFLNSQLPFPFPMDTIQADIEHELHFSFPIVLFSSEFLFYFDLEKMAWIKNIAENKGYQIKIIAYVRDFVPLYESSYGQAIKRELCTQSYKEYLSSHTLSQYAIINPYLDFFGKENVIVKKYAENFNTEELINSFFDIFKVDFNIHELKLPDIINANLAFSDLEIMRKLNQYFNYGQAKWMSDYLLEQLNQGQPKLKVSDAEDAQFILKKHNQETIEINKLINQGDLLNFDDLRNSGCDFSDEDQKNHIQQLIDHLITKLSEKQSISLPIPSQKSNISFFVPPGHFYSPIADSANLRMQENKIWKSIDFMAGINLNISKQKELLEQLKPYTSSINYPIENNGDNKSYFYNNDQYPALDAEFLYAALCHFRPKRMIEVGSGYSSLITADVNRRVLENTLNFTCIEPYPRQFLIDGIEGITQLVVKKVEDVELSFFEQLEAGDILFIDSSHVSKTGSDVNFLFFEVIPRLKKGVMVHIHDIFLPDEYPRGWVIEQGRNWNEQYLLRAFLQFNSEWEIIWSACFMGTRYKELVQGVFPHYPELGGGGSFWLKRI